MVVENYLEYTYIVIYSTSCITIGMYETGVDNTEKCGRSAVVCNATSICLNKLEFDLRYALTDRGSDCRSSVM